MVKKHFRKNKNYYSKAEIRTYSQKALSAIKQIDEKYPKGISDITSITEEARAWIQIKIQQFRECCTKIVFSQIPVWWEAMRLTRNDIAHQEEDLSDEKFSSVVSTLFANLAKIKSDLEENIKRLSSVSKKKRKFEKFAPPKFGTEFEKKQLVDAMADFFNPAEPKDLKIDFPKNKFSKIAEEIVYEIASRNNNKDYISNHFGLSENVHTDILEWLEKTYSTLEKENPFAEEEAFIKKLQSLKSEQIKNDFEKIEKNYKPFGSANIDFSFYKKQFTESESLKKAEARNRRVSAIAEKFTERVQQSLFQRKTNWQLKMIDELRKKFLKELYEKLEKFKKLEKLLSPFFDETGFLWDMSKGLFRESGFDILKNYADILERDESLMELARILGKHSRAQKEFEKELREKIVIKTEYKPKPAFKGQIAGIKTSNDISSVLPTELAMLKNPATKKLFRLKFAQRQLMSFRYENIVPQQKIETEMEEVSKEKKEPKGPIIICVDTSGSMNGTPESIAKTVTFALTKIAVEEKRKCYLISFSTGIETLDLSDFSNKPLEKLVKFLKMSFNGGTDVSPALNHSLEMLSQNNWKNADVLMVSDFVMGNLPDDLTAKIEAEQDKDTLFYSLVIGSSGNGNTLKCFNHNWVYDTASTNPTRKLVERLHEIRKHHETKGEARSA